MGWPAIGKSGLGISNESGRKRVPFCGLPIRMIAFNVLISNSTGKIARKETIESAPPQLRPKENCANPTCTCKTVKYHSGVQQSLTKPDLTLKTNESPCELPFSETVRSRMHGKILLGISSNLSLNRTVPTVDRWRSTPRSPNRSKSI